MMLILKMLVLKMVKNIYKYIYIYINISWAFLAGMTQNKQKAYFHCGPSSRTICKSAKKKKVKCY